MKGPYKCNDGNLWQYPNSPNLKKNKIMKKNMLRVLTLLENKLISFPVIKSAELWGGELILVMWFLPEIKTM